MNLSRPFLAIIVTAALALGGVAPVASAASTAQPLTLVGPTDGQKLKTPYVKFSWEAPVDEQMVEIVVSTSKKTASNGKLPTRGKNYLTTWYPDLGSSTFTDKTYSYAPDTYYWQVLATDAAGVEYLSPVRDFVVPVFFELSKAKVKMIKAKYDGQRYLEGSAVMQCNYGESQYYTQFVMDVYKGKKRISQSIVGQGDCLGMFKIKTAAIAKPPAKGTKLTIKLYGRSTHNSTVRWGGSKIKKTKGEVTTIKYTVK